MTELSETELGHINLRGNADDADFVDGVASVLGQRLPVEANTLTLSEHRIYWLGPDEWQIVTAPGRVAGLVTQLEDKLSGQHIAINDMNGGQVALHLAGSDVPDLLASGCTLDLQPSNFAVGDCAQTGLAKANVLVGHIDAGPLYEIIVRRSFSEYLLRWLRQSIRSPAGSASS